MKLRPAIILLALFTTGFLLVGVGCSSDPNVEGAKLDLRNQNLDKALDNISVALENNPENAEAWQVKAQIHHQQMRNENNDLERRTQALDQMIEAYDNALTHGGDQGAITQELKRMWVREMQAGGNYYEQGAEDEEAYNRALHHFRNATKVQPDSVAGYVNMGYAYLASGQQEQSIQPFEEAIDRGATDPQIFTFLGQLYRRQNSDQQAVAILEKGREHHPEDEDILNQLLNAYVVTDQINKARSSFETAVAENPDNEIYRYNYGSLLLQAEEYDAAIEHLEVAVDIDPNYASALYNLGAAYQNKGVNLNDRIGDMDDQLRQERADLSDAEIEQRQEEIDQLVEQRRSLFQEAIPHLVKARQIMEQNGDDPSDVCRALFQAYAQTNDSEKAKDAADCAGIDVN